MQDHSEHFNHMIEVMKRFCDISPALVIRLRELTRCITYSAGDTVLHLKEIQSRSWFQVSGLTAEFSRHQRFTREAVTWLWYPDDFVFSIDTFFIQEPFDCKVKAITDCCFMYIDFKDLEQLIRESEEASLLSEKIRSEASKKRKQHYTSMALTTDRKVKILFQQHPEVFLYCTKVELAEFLEIATDTLRRVLKRYCAISSVFILFL
jgi:CRP-like cAMP-binding protein